MSRFIRTTVASVLGFLAFAGSSHGLQELFRADMEDSPLYGYPTARTGEFEHYSRVSVVPLGGGFLSPILQAYGNGGDTINQAWRFAARPTAGILSLRWEMSAANVSTNTGYFGVQTWFTDPNGGGHSRGAYFYPSGAISFGAAVTNAQYGTNVVHRYRMDHDFSTGEGTLWMDDRTIARNQEFDALTRCQAVRAVLYVPSNYHGFVYIDNVAAVRSQPQVPYQWADFDSHPVDNLATGALIGYPVGDSVTNVRKTFFDVDTVLVTNRFTITDRRLEIRNGNSTMLANTNLRVVLAPNAAVLPDGLYQNRFTVHRTDTNGTVEMALLGAAGDLVRMGLFAQSLWVVSNGSWYAVAAMPTNQDQAVKTLLDTQRQRFAVYVNGAAVLTNWPAAALGTPTEFEITTFTDDVGSVYFDGIGIERRGRNGLYALDNLDGKMEIQVYDAATRRLDRAAIVNTAIPATLTLTDAEFGSRGYLYVCDYTNVALRVYNPYTLSQDLLFTHPSLHRPRAIASFRDGRLAVLMRRTNTTACSIGLFEGLPTMNFITSLVSSISVNAFWMRLSPDERTLLVGIGLPDGVERYDARTGADLGPLASVAAQAPNITDIAVRPGNRLYVLGTNVLEFDYVQDVYRGPWGEAGHLHTPTAMGFLENGNLVVAEGFTNGLVEFDAFTGHYLGAYPNPGQPLYAVSRIVETPSLGILQMANRGGGEFALTAEGEEDRFYSVFSTTNLPVGAWRPVMTNYAETDYGSWPVIPCTNPATATFRVFHAAESEL